MTNGTLPAIAWMPRVRPEFKFVLQTVAVGLGYFLAARLSLLLQIQPENIAVCWPAAGLSVGALIVLGRQARWSIATGVVLATLAANVAHGAAPLVALIFGLCNAIECLLVAIIVERLFGHPFQLDSLKRIFGFVVAAIAATMIAALPAALTLAYLLDVPVPIPTLWRTWAESDLVGIIAAAPVLIAMPAALRERLPGHLLFEGILLLNLVVVAAFFVFSHLPVEASWPAVIPLGLLLPILLWQAVRFPPIFAALNSFAVALMIVYCVGRGLGALGQPTQPLADRVLAAQGAIMTLSLCVLVFAAMVAGQRNVEAALRTSEQRLRLATEAANLGVYERRIKEDRTVWENQRMYEIFGHSHADGTVSLSQFIETYLDPSERKHFIAGYASRIASGRVNMTCRIRRKDGAWREIEVIGAVDRDANGEPERVVGVLADITERRRAEEKQALLIGELDHRVKNALEGVATLIISTGRNANNVPEFIDTLSGRIQSMARAHQLLSREHWSGVALKTLVTEQLEPYATPGRITIEGPSIKLTADATQVLSMVLHELVTNAAKYGALSSAAGRINVTWYRDPPSNGDVAARALRIEWSETNGPPVKPPTRAGFGSKVIREPIAYQLHGAVEVDYAPEGLRCRISAPLSEVLAE